MNAWHIYGINVGKYFHGPYGKAFYEISYDFYF